MHHFEIDYLVNNEGSHFVKVWTIGRPEVATLGPYYNRASARWAADQYVRQYPQ